MPSEPHDVEIELVYDPEMRAKVDALAHQVGNVINGHEPEVILNVLAYFSADLLARIACPDCRPKAMAGLSSQILETASRIAGDGERRCSRVH